MAFPLTVWKMPNGWAACARTRHHHSYRVAGNPVAASVSAVLGLFTWRLSGW